jgi:hypothetical protein
MPRESFPAVVIPKREAYYEGSATLDDELDHFEKCVLLRNRGKRGHIFRWCEMI